MSRLVFAVLWGWMAAGLLGVVAVNRKHPGEPARSLWKKFTFYVLIVHVVVLSLLFRPHDLWRTIATAILLAGTWEVTRLYLLNTPRQHLTLLLGIAAYALIAAGFALFAFRVHPHLQLFVYGVVVVFDGISQIAGQTLGRVKLAPSISPNKTLEGLLGGLAAGVITAVLLAPAAHLPRHVAAAAGFGAALFAAGGDLLASLYKRKQGAKDFSRLLPGQGGVLDRFNGFMAAGGACFLLVESLGPDSGIWRVALLTVLFGCVLFFSEILYGHGRLPAEISRKAGHVTAGFVALLMPLMDISAGFALALCGLYTGLLAAGRRLGVLNSIHAVDRGHSFGGYCFPLALCGSYIAFLYHGMLSWFCVPVLILAISDPIAALVGRTVPAGPYRVLRERRTLSGSAAFFASAMCVAWLGSSLLSDIAGTAPLSLPQMAGAAGTAAVVEGITPWGFDNLTIPFAALGMLILLG